jgi:hypothetical protein
MLMKSSSLLMARKISIDQVAVRVDKEKRGKSRRSSVSIHEVEPVVVVSDGKWLAAGLCVVQQIEHRELLRRVELQVQAVADLRPGEAAISQANHRAADLERELFGCIACSHRVMSGPSCGIVVISCRKLNAHLRSSQGENDRSATSERVV